MKKSLLVFLPLLLIGNLSLFSCNNNDENDKVFLSYGDYTVNMENFGDYDAAYKYDLTYAELEAKLGKENFAVAVCATDGCGCWTYLSSLIKDYVSRNHVVIYRIKDTEFVGKNDHGLKVIQNSSSFGLINLDKKARTISSANGDKETEKQNMFDAFMNRYSALPRMYYVSSDDVKNKIIKEGVNATVYFGRSSCPDCTYIDKHILIPYFQNHKGTLYIYDMQEVFNTPSYDQLKADFNMTAQKSEDFGYKTGVVPTLQYYQNGVLTSAAVAFNDTVTNHVVSESYYSENRVSKLAYLNNFKGTKVIEGLPVPESDLILGTYWEQDKAIVYYRPLINAFLNYALPKSNFNY